jgi:dTDP-D-glucose 4,6-dehydratase
MRHLVTGAAGFLGFHLAAKLMGRGDAVVGFDNVNDYYDVGLKEARLTELDRVAAETGAKWCFLRADLPDRAAVEAASAEAGPFDRVIHLAAQAGVRHSPENPLAYVASNLTGFTTSSGPAVGRERPTSPTPRPRASTAPTGRCPFPKGPALTTRCSSMPRPSGRTS